MSQITQPRKIFCFYRNAEVRIQALQDAKPGAAERYLLYGADQFIEQGFSVRHNLKSLPSLRPKKHWRNKIFNNMIKLIGGVGGDFSTVWSFRRQANESDLIFSTVDSVGIPLVLMQYFGIIRHPIVYVSIGLPEKLARISNRFLLRRYLRAFSQSSAIIAYGFEEAEKLREWLKKVQADHLIHFVRFGVDDKYFHPLPDVPVDVDVLTIGVDRQRDFPLLIQFAQNNPDVSLRVITSEYHLSTFQTSPGNIEILTNIPFHKIREYIAAAKVVALPVRENSYSGATTTLLQAMSMEKPVIVSAVGAIRCGYALQDGVNCKLVPPGDFLSFEQAILALLADLHKSRNIGINARQTIVENLSWDHYVTDLVSIFKNINPAELTENNL